MADQRCPFPLSPSVDRGSTCTPDSTLTLAQTEEFFDQIATSQSQRLNDQRASVSNFPELKIAHKNLGHQCATCAPQEPTDDFFNMLIKYQSTRIEDQRCSLPEPGCGALSGADEDFFSLIQKVQAKRMDEQRADLQADAQEGTDMKLSKPPAASS
ncbi:G-protein-signaling modulator 1 [Esox lucius]|nr:G-protein-signaling modulator 1 [Esox lucius]XP_010863560.1 G-protein-signaling modulator 1 [Esox lucius]